MCAIKKLSLKAFASKLSRINVSPSLPKFGWQCGETVKSTICTLKITFLRELMRCYLFFAAENGPTSLDEQFMSTPIIDDFYCQSGGLKSNQMVHNSLLTIKVMPLNPGSQIT